VVDFEAGAGDGDGEIELLRDPAGEELGQLDPADGFRDGVGFLFPGALDLGAHGIAKAHRAVEDAAFGEVAPFPDGGREGIGHPAGFVGVAAGFLQDAFASAKRGRGAPELVGGPAGLGAAGLEVLRDLFALTIGHHIGNKFAVASFFADAGFGEPIEKGVRIFAARREAVPGKTQRPFRRHGERSDGILGKGVETGGDRHFRDLGPHRLDGWRRHGH
jgi:hypothetical protein